MKKHILLYLLPFIYSTSLIAQDFEKNTTNRPNPNKSLTIIVSTLASGTLLQLVGLGLRVEANHLFLKASRTENSISSAESKAIRQSRTSQYEQENTDFETMLYSSWAFLGAGSILTITGVVFAILDALTKPPPVTPPENTVFENTSFSVIPLIPSHNIGLTLTPQQISIGGRY